MWSPEHVYQDLERDDFFFMYVPYDDADRSLAELSDFLLANVDYSDDELVEFIYFACDHLQRQGVEYLGEGMYKDFVRITERIRERQPITVDEEVIPMAKSMLWDRSSTKEKENPPMGGIIPLINCITTTKAISNATLIIFLIFSFLKIIPPCYCPSN